MNNHLIHTSLVIMWGRRKLFSLSSLGGLGIVVMALGTVFFFAVQIWSSTLLHNLPVLWLMTLVAVIHFAIYAILLLLTKTVLKHLSGTQYLQLSRLPFTPLTDWLITSLPILLLTLVTSILLLPLQISLTHAFDLTWIYWLSSSLLGTTAALALSLWPSGWLKKVFFLFIFLLVSSHILTELPHPPSHYLLQLTGLLAVLLIILERGLWQSYKYPDYYRTSRRISPFFTLPHFLLPAWWFLLKIMRSSAITPDLLLLILLSTFLDWQLYHIPLSQSVALYFEDLNLIILSILAASLQVLIKRYRAAEQFSLGGLTLLSKRYQLAVSSLAFIFAVPTWIVCLHFLPLSWLIFSSFTALGIGNLIGTYFLTQPTTISSQIASTCLSSLFAYLFFKYFPPDNKLFFLVSSCLALHIAWYRLRLSHNYSYGYI